MNTKRLLAATVLAGLLVAGGAAVPATAATDLRTGSTAIVTIKGHVLDRAGKPIKGVEAYAGCPCDSPMGAHQASHDFTSASGYYSLRIQKRFASTLYFSDPKHRFFPKPGTLKHAAGGYASNVRLAATSRISGTITGGPDVRVHFTSVQFYKASSGRGAGSAHALTDGTYVAHLKPGSYKVKFGGGSDYTNEVWYGGVPTSAESPTVTVTVGYAGTVSGIDATITPKPTISGTFTVDGQDALDDVTEHIELSLADSVGTVLKRSTVYSGFSFVGLTPGTYTLSAMPAVASGDFVKPFSQTVTLAPGTAIRDLVLGLTTNPGSASSTRSTGISFTEISKGLPKTGTLFRGKIAVSSYADPTGGKVITYVNGAKVDSRVVPYSGAFTLRYRPTKSDLQEGHRFVVKVRFLGTPTARSRSEVVYEFDH